MYQGFLLFNGFEIIVTKRDGSKFQSLEEIVCCVSNLDDIL